ncbi:hypothetical protein RJG79_03335 [Mycoplasmatota bacterium WC44]
MKKFLILFMSVVLLTGCTTKNQEVEATVEPMSSLEVLSEVFKNTEVEMLPTIQLYGTDEFSLRQINYILGEENNIDLNNYVSAAMNKPMMTVDARIVFVMQLDSTDNMNQIEDGLVSLERYFVCVSVKEYQIVSNGNYVMFVGVPEHQQLVDAFLELDLSL